MDNIYYILGQHDLYHRESNDEFNSHFNLLIDNPRLIYAHGKEISINNKTFFFSNWIENKKKKVLPNNQVDYWLGHSTLGLFNSELDFDNTLFKKGLFGDIHKPYEKDNYMSVGVPYQQTLSDDVNIGFCIIDTDNDSVTRVKSEDENHIFSFDYKN